MKQQKNTMQSDITELNFRDTNDLPSESSIPKLDVKKVFIQTMTHAINDNRLDEKFFCRPDCLAGMWIILNRNYESVLFDPFINCLENFLLELLTDPRCHFKWCRQKAMTQDSTSDSDRGNILNELRATLKLSSEFVSREISILDIALIILELQNYQQNRRLFSDGDFVVEPTREEWLRLLMYRLKAISDEEYNEQGFLE